MQLAERIRGLRGGHWLAAYGAILGGWALLFALAQMPGHGGVAPGCGAACRFAPGAAGYGLLTLMWSAMAAAMMLPGFLPVLAAYDDLGRTGATTRRGALGLIGGYLAVWAGFSLVAAAAQLWLAGAGLLDAGGARAERGLSVALLAGAGLYQFSSLKAACLSRCRQPLSFFMQHWRPTALNPLALGLRSGMVCLGCCWALMALGFVGGTMNLAWMGLATVLMAVEKLPRWGRHVTAPLGVALLGGAGLVASGMI